MKEGWIALHRKLQNCDIWLDEEPFDRRSAWIDLLLSANHDTHGMIFDGKRIEIKRGQMITSVRKLSAKWRWGKNKTLAYLRLLEELGMIEREADSRRTLLTIVNYGFYQGEGASERTVKGQSEDSQRTVRGHSQATNNNDNNDNNDNNENKKHIYGEYKHVRLTDPEYERLVNDYGETETHEAIKFLDEYKERKGYKCKNDNLTIRKWVFDAVGRSKPTNVYDAWANA